MVGGLADWFAVTALFRHPLGIPIPHTALLTKNRAKITDALVNTVENDLLSKETLAGHLRQTAIFGKLLDAASRELNSDEAERMILALSREVLDRLPTEQIALMLEKELKAYLLSVDLMPLVEKAMDGVLTHGYEAKAFDLAVGKFEEWAVKPETRQQMGTMAMKALEGLQVNGFMGFAVNAFIGMMDADKVGGMIQKFLLTTIWELQQDGSPKREGALGAIRKEMLRLKGSPEFAEQIGRWQQGWIGGWEFGEPVSGMIERLMEKARAFVDSPDYVNGFVRPKLSLLLDKLREDQGRSAKAEGWIQGKLAVFLEANHSKIGQLVREKLNQFDNETLIAMMEDRIGQDLQWIRINGALCGFLIGLVLAVFKLAV
ncbi:DUF445 domain-containing protein [Paenibacillus sp. CC-CFT747]|nr:DUF445 domain-containing protein [Paenibacillus sp. CC-CFT747]